MAHLVRQKKTFYVGTDGKRVPAGTKGAKKVTEASRKWYGAGIPGMGKKRVPLASDKRVAQRMLEDLVTAGERGQAGIRSANESARVLAPMVEEFGTVLARDCGPLHVADVLRNVNRVLTGCKLTTLGDLLARDLAARVEAFVWSLTKEAGAAPRTANATGKHARQFTRWLWRKKKELDADPLAGMDLPGLSSERKRRAFAADELEKIIATTEGAKADPRESLPPADRAAVYTLAATTGFRAAELAALTPADFALDGNPPVVSLAGKHTKNGKDARLPLSPASIARMRPILERKPAAIPVWPGRWFRRAAAMLWRDMKRANVPVKTQEGRADFHSFRHTFITFLGRGTASMKAVQDLARHSTPVLTVGRYSHADDAEKAAAVGALPLAGGATASPVTPVEALAAIGLAVMLAVLDTRRDTPGVDSTGDFERPRETDASKKRKRKGGKGVTIKP